MKLFRCMSCEDPTTGRPGVEFEAAKPVCPACGADGTLVVELETIHFDPPSGKPGRGLRRAACDDRIKIDTGLNLMMSGEPAAVTCRKCKATPAWKTSAEARGVPVVQTEPAEPPKGD